MDRRIRHRHSAVASPGERRPPGEVEIVQIQVEEDRDRNACVDPQGAAAQRSRHQRERKNERNGLIHVVLVHVRGDHEEREGDQECQEPERVKTASGFFSR